MPDPILTADDHRFFTASIALAVMVWPIGFALGAYGVVFYSTLFQIWAVSITALMAALVLGRRRGRAYISQNDMLILLLPTLWLAGEILLSDRTSDGIRLFRGALTLLVGLVSVPHILRIVIQISTPEATSIRSRRLNYWLFGLTALIALAAFFFGYFNHLVISCQDFSVAGDYAPPNCSKTKLPIW